jgi:mono/diheme cytochrome c family protein
MPTTPKKGKRLRWILFLGVLSLICISIGLAVFHTGPWVVPLADKERKNPLTVSEANVAAAKQIYGTKCSDCHGEAGKGDGSDAMMYDPPPSDLTDAAKMNKLTDGEIFYQITEGRKPMPSFKKKLTEEQRWQLVLLVRSFAAAPAAAPPAVPETKTPEPTSKPH